MTIQVVTQCLQLKNNLCYISKFDQENSTYQPVWNCFRYDDLQITYIGSGMPLEAVCTADKGKGNLSWHYETAIMNKIF